MIASNAKVQPVYARVDVELKHLHQLPEKKQQNMRFINGQKRSSLSEVYFYIRWNDYEMMVEDSAMVQWFPFLAVGHCRQTGHSPSGFPDDPPCSFVRVFFHTLRG